MFRLTLICVGKLKERHWQEAQAEYIKRLAPAAKLTVVEVEPEALGPTVTAAQSMKMEGERIVKRLPERAWVIALDKGGKTLDSVGFAGWLKERGGNGEHLVFVIGGAAGLDHAVLDRATAKISLSAMTFTHEMARIFLLEQIYRAWSINEGKKYHY